MSTRTPSGNSTSVICAARDSVDPTDSGLMSRLVCYFKGPKHEIFVAGIFTQIRPVWVGDLGTRLKKSKKFMFGALYYALFPGIFVVAYSAKKYK
jgi:hypothetical protein